MMTPLWTATGPGGSQLYYKALLDRIARQGPDAFYVGPQATKIVQAVNGAARNPSRMTAGDLASYDAKPRDPLCTRYRAYRICSMGPPSSGGVTVLMILKQLERFDMASLGPGSRRKAGPTDRRVRR